MTTKTRQRCTPCSLRKHAHATYSDFSRLLNDNFQFKFFDYCHIFAQNIDCGYTLERVPTIYICFEAKIGKNVYPCKPQFYYIKVGYKGCTLHGQISMMFVAYLISIQLAALFQTNKNTHLRFQALTLLQ